MELAKRGGKGLDWMKNSETNSSGDKSLKNTLVEDSVEDLRGKGQ